MPPGCCMLNIQRGKKRIGNEQKNRERREKSISPLSPDLERERHSRVALLTERRQRATKPLPRTERGRTGCCSSLPPILSLHTRRRRHPPDIGCELSRRQRRREGRNGGGMSQLLLSAMEEGKGAFSPLFPPLTTIPSDVPFPPPPLAA